MASRVGDSYTSDVGNTSSEDGHLAGWILEMSDDNIILKRKRKKHYLGTL